MVKDLNNCGVFSSWEDSSYNDCLKTRERRGYLWLNCRANVRLVYGEILICLVAVGHGEIRKDLKVMRIPAESPTEVFITSSGVGPQSRIGQVLLRNLSGLKSEFKLCSS
jgi:hypothetical protein